jgi:protein SCO1/2
MNTPTLDRRALLLGAFGLLAGCGESNASPAPSWKGADLADKGYGNDFRLKDTTGKERTLADWRGKAVLLHFGFTQCPDACPTMLARAAEVRKMLGAQKDKLQVLFVTLDPERDTLDVLKPYTATFQAGIVGLTGAPERIAALAKACRIEYRREPGRAGAYDLDHSSVIVLVDPAGRAVARFTHETPPETIQAKLAQLVT